MRFLLIGLFCFTFILNAADLQGTQTASSKRLDVTEKFDCIVVGAGISGFSASVAAARAGAKVLLIDKMPSVGGTAVYAMPAMLSGWPKHHEAGGIADELAKLLLERKGLRWRINNAVYDENIMQLVMLDMLRDAGVKTLFNALVTGVESEGRLIKRVIVQFGTEKIFCEAKNFIDATGNASLSVLAGAEVITPEIDKSMTKTLMFKVDNVKYFDSATADAKFDPIVRTRNFPVAIQDCFMGSILVRQDEAMLNLTAVIGDAADPVQYNAMYEELLQQIPKITAWLKKEIPEFKDMAVTKIAPMLGVRYTRSIVSRRQLTMADVHNPEPTEEVVALCGRYIGGHYINGFRSPWSSRVTGKMEIPYGAIRSRSFDNLLAAGSIIGVQPELISAVRLNVTCIASGQAAGIAAALNIPPYEVLRKELLRQNCLLAR